VDTVKKVFRDLSGRVIWAGFEQEHRTGRIFAEPGGQDAARAASAHDDHVVPLRHGRHFIGFPRVD
jgi:hypothetical protein